MTYVHTHARSRTHNTQKHRSWPSQMGKLEARRLYRDCLASDGCYICQPWCFKNSSREVKNGKKNK